MNRQTSRRGLRAFAAIGAASIALSAAGAQAANFYDGKTVTILVGLSPGGTVDTFARQFSAAWAKYIPGKPTMIVKNMTGGGGMKATNFLYEAAAKDGLTILWGPWIPIAQALNYKGFKARYEKFEFLGGTPDTRVSYARTDSVPGGLKSPADIMKAKELIIGGNAATGMAHLSARLPLDVLGVNYKQIGGYRGGSRIFLALQQGEIQYTGTSIGTFRRRSGDYVQSGKALGLFYMVPVEADGSYERNPHISEMPAFPDLYKQVHGKMPSGEVWNALNWFINLIGTINYVGLAPPGSPAQAVADLRAGYAAASKDKTFIAQWIKRNGVPPEFIGVDKGSKVIASLANTDPKILATFKELLDKGTKSATKVKKQPTKKKKDK
jgi:tripartite-type tricarboxylate transporter receptor subunit TctC